MRAYVPTDIGVAALVAAAWAAAAAIGFLLARFASVRTARLASWTLLALGTAVVDRLAAAQPPGLRMVALATFALIAMKSIVMTEERARGVAPPSIGTWTAFALGWVGMQPRLFSRPSRALGGVGPLVASGAVAVLAGALAVVLARAAWTWLHSRLVSTVLLMGGLSALFHFGLLNLVAAAWRARGVPADALFRAPWRSESLAEFWARRWNLAFSEMTSIAVYRPLAGRVGRGPGLLAGFAMSGLLHELAISLPVRAGFGLPLAYFLIHGSLVAGERALAARGRPVGGAWGRAWTLFWLAAPVPLLFHRPFLAGVAWPLIGIPAEG